MKTFGVGFPFRTVHPIETIDPKSASVGPDILTSGGSTCIYISFTLILIQVRIIYKLASVYSVYG